MLELSDPIELIRLNVGLENLIDSLGHLFPLLDSAPNKVAHFVIACHSGGCERFFRHDLPLSMREKLSGLAPDHALYNFELVKGVLGKDWPCEDVWGGKGYVFRRAPGPIEFPDVVLHDGAFVVRVDDEPVARAWSQEQNEKAAELAVEVLPEYRRRGYARQVCAAWANHVMRNGRVAFYSHLHNNTASEALARSLGVIQYAVSAGYS